MEDYRNGERIRQPALSGNAQEKREIRNNKGELLDGSQELPQASSRSVEAIAAFVAGW
jgi:hypothetical protein